MIPDYRKSVVPISELNTYKDSVESASNMQERVRSTRLEKDEYFDQFESTLGISGMLNKEN